MNRYNIILKNQIRNFYFAFLARGTTVDEEGAIILKD